MFFSSFWNPYSARREKKEVIGLFPLSFFACEPFAPKPSPLSISKRMSSGSSFKTSASTRPIPEALPVRCAALASPSGSGGNGDDGSDLCPNGGRCGDKLRGVTAATVALVSLDGGELCGERKKQAGKVRKSQYSARILK